MYVYIHFFKKQCLCTKEDWRLNASHWQSGGGRWRGAGGDSSQATQAVVTILQVLVALVAAGVARRVSGEAASLQEQLLLGASGLTATLWVAASCNAKHHREGAVTSHDQKTKSGRLPETAGPGTGR